MPTSSVADFWETIAVEAGAESPLWADALAPPEARDLVPVFSPLGAERYALGLETIYEGYLLHYGTPRLFAPRDRDTTLLLGDYLYAHGLVRVAAHGDVGAVADLAALISLCAQLRADGDSGDGEAWAATAAHLGQGPLTQTHDPDQLRVLAGTAARSDAVEQALVLHRTRVG